MKITKEVQLLSFDINLLYNKINMQLQDLENGESLNLIENPKEQIIDDCKSLTKKISNYFNVLPSMNSFIEQTRDQIKNEEINDSQALAFVEHYSNHQRNISFMYNRCVKILETLTIEREEKCKE